MAKKIAPIGKTHRKSSMIFIALLAFLFSGLQTQAAERTMRIMSIGDSITAGYTDNPSWNIEFTFSYRLGLYKRMTNAGYTIQYVGSSIEPWNGISGYPKKIGQPDLRELDLDYHNGYGWLTADGVTNFIDEWMGVDNPDVILLMLGNIDFQFYDSAKIAGDHLNDLAEKILNTWPRVHLVVAEMTPFSWYRPGVVEYNNYIRNVMVPHYAAQGKRIISVDQYKNCVTGGVLSEIDWEMFSGGHHLTPEGYDRMGQTWFEGIQRIFPRAPVSIVTPPHVSAEGHFKIRFHGAPNAIYEIERAPEVTGPWARAFRRLVADASGVFELDVPDAATAVHQFYRIADPFK